MKITKQRLKQIIKEELETVSMGADIEGYPEPEEDEDPMASRLGTREEQLLSRILSRAVVDRYDSLEDLAADLGIEMTSDMARYIGSLKANPMYGSSMEEGLRASRIRMQTAQELAAALAELEAVMKYLLDQKVTNAPGSTEHEEAQERLQRLAAVATEYADVGRLRERSKE